MKKALILRRVKKDLKIEVALNHLNLKNIKDEEINYFFCFLFYFKESLVFFIILESLKDFPLYLFDI